MREHYGLTWAGKTEAVRAGDTPATGASQFAERLRAVVGEYDWNHRAVTVSVGASTLRLRKNDVERHENAPHSALGLAGDRHRHLALAQPALACTEATPAGALH